MGALRASIGALRRPVERSTGCLKTTKARRAWLPFFAVLLVLLATAGRGVEANNPEFNAHRPPSFPTASWFEGWYVRLTTDNTSFAVAIGHFPGQKFESPSATCFALVQGVEDPKLVLRHVFFDKLKLEGCRGVLHDPPACRIDVNVSVETVDPVPSCGPAQGASRKTTESGLCVDHNLKLVRGAGSGGDGPGAVDIEQDGQQQLEALTTEMLLSRRRELLGDDGVVSVSSSLAASSNSSSCFVKFERSNVTIVAKLGDVEIEISSAVTDVETEPWSRISHTPEGWLGIFGHALPLRYDVLSLATPSTYRLLVNGSTVDAGIGSLHMEKNWGRSFPPQWIWSQGHHRLAADVTGQVRTESFTLAGGSLPISLFHGWIKFHIPMFVFSLHSPAIPGGGIALDPFWPAYYYRKKVRSCQGGFFLELFGLSHIVEIRARAHPESFTTLPCPTAEGFQVDASESFRSRVAISVFARRFPFSPRQYSRLVLRTVFENAAFEFGGEFMCGGSSGEDDTA